MRGILPLIAIWTAYELIGQTISRRFAPKTQLSAFLSLIAIHGVPALLIFWIYRPPMVAGTLAGFGICAAAGVLLRIILDQLPEYYEHLRDGAYCGCGNAGFRKVVEAKVSVEVNLPLFAVFLAHVGALGPLLEEILYRGLLETIARSYLGTVGAALFTASLFSAGHVLFKNDRERGIREAVYFMVCSLTFSAAYARFGLVGATAAHGAFNVIEQVIYAATSKWFPNIKVPLFTYFVVPSFIHGRYATRGDQAEA